MDDFTAFCFDVLAFSSELFRATFAVFIVLVGFLFSLFIATFTVYSIARFLYEKYKEYKK